MIKRRHVLAGFCGAMLPAGRAAWADSGAPSLNLLVAGPAGEQTSRWGNACALAMSAGFPGMPDIIPQPAGGLDGVTGANQLDALVVPDGKTAAILPGAALIAWMTGDTRVHFDPTHWEPILAATNAGVLVVRLHDAAPSVKSLQDVSPLRLAADSAHSGDLAALLALQRLNIPAAVVFGLRGTDAKTRAFIAGEVDAVFLSGEGVPEDIAPLTANGGAPVFCTGQLDAAGATRPDPLLPGLPDLETFAGACASPFTAAYQAAAAAARLDFFMVLPRLTDPGALAAWRQAGGIATASTALAAAASASSVLLQNAGITAANLAALNLSPTDQTGLQAFIAQRFGQQAG